MHELTKCKQKQTKTKWIWVNVHDKYSLGDECMLLKPNIYMLPVYLVSIALLKKGCSNTTYRVGM